MAARMLQIRRVLSLLSRNQPRASLPTELPLWSVSLSSSFLSSRDDFNHRRFQCGMGSTVPVKDEKENVENGSSTAPALTHDTTVKHTVSSNLKVSARHDLALVYTCKVCETRSVKTVCRESYDKGIIVVRCGGCNNLHLIADRLGWFGEPGSIEDFLAARGEEVKTGSVDTLNLTLEDLAGKGGLNRTE